MNKVKGEIKIFVIYDDENFAYGSTLQAAIDSWRECYCEYPDLKTVTIIKGVKQKLTLSLEPIVEKPVTVKK